MWSAGRYEKEHQDQLPPFAEIVVATCRSAALVGPAGFRMGGGGHISSRRITVDVDGKRLSSFDPAAVDNPPRKTWTEPIREIKRPTHGYLGLQNHDPGDIVWFKEVSVRPLDFAK
jgi:hypothetical protein